jgi:hypothetical protein
MWHESGEEERVEIIGEKARGKETISKAEMSVDR